MRKPHISLFLLLILVGSLYPLIPIYAEEPTGSSTIATVGEPIDWPSFWKTFKQYALWDLEWYDGYSWVSVKEDMDVQLSYPEPNKCKVNLVFDASHAGNYRLTHAINKVARDYVTKVDKYQYDLTYDDFQVTFDWSDCAEIPGLVFTHGVKDDLFWFRIRRDNVPLGAHVEIDPATVATNTDRYGVQYGFQRKSFYAEGLFWAFYESSNSMYYKTSNNGVDWSSAILVGGGQANMFSLFFDVTYVHYVRTFYDGDLTYYRRGIPEDDGSITWSAAEQLILDGTSSNSHDYPCITVDTDGYAWIGVNHDAGDVESPYVLKNANNDGTWALDFAYQLDVTDDYYWRVSPVPLTDGKVYVIYTRSGQAPLGQLWDGDWDAGEESDLADFNIEDGYGFSAVAIDDNVHFVYNRDVTYQICYNNRTFGVGWMEDDVLVQDIASSTACPVLSADPSADTLYCFWTRFPIDDHVFYKKYDAGWDADPTDWIDETADDIQSDYLCSSFYMDYGGYIGLLYVTKTGSPYNVRFEFLTVGAAGVDYTRFVSQPISMVSQSYRIWSLSRLFSQSLTMTLNGNRMFTAMREVSQSLTASMNAERVFSAVRGVSQTLTATMNTNRAFTAIRTASQTLTASISVGRTWDLSRTASQTISFTYNVLASMFSVFQRTASLTFNLGLDTIRSWSLTRVAEKAISLQSVAVTILGEVNLRVANLLITVSADLGVWFTTINQINFVLLMFHAVPLYLSYKVFKDPDTIWFGISSMMWFILAVAILRDNIDNYLIARLYTLFGTISIILALANSFNWLQKPQDDYWDDL